MDVNHGNYLCETGLALGLAIGGGTATAPASHRRQPESCLPFGSSNISRKPSLTLSLSDDMVHGASPTAGAGDVEVNGNKFNDEGRQGRPSSPHSAVSSFSTVAYPSPVKKEKGTSEEVEIERGSSRGGSDEDDDGSARKKLRLTKEQSALLEDRFKEHSTLNPKQKQALAKQLNLRPRQVEVWFQNRRARTKLKQTEVDCEFLKRCCERLTDENRRLQKELQELKALKFAPQLYMQYPAATLTMCPSCERLGGAGGDGSKAANGAAGPFVMAPKPHFFNPFTHSAAC